MYFFSWVYKFPLPYTASSICSRDLQSDEHTEIIAQHMTLLWWLWIKSSGEPLPLKCRVYFPALRELSAHHRRETG